MSTCRPVDRLGRRRLAGALIGLLCAALAGCAVGPNFARPVEPRAAHYLPGGERRTTVKSQGVAQQFTPGAQVTGDWWRLFDNRRLEDILAQALAANPGLAAAQASLRASEYSLRSGYGIFFPQTEAAARGTRERLSPLTLGEKAPASIFNLFTLSASASYALDIFGGERRQIEALGAEVDEQRATERATYVTLLANVVNTVIARAGYSAEIDATQQLIRLQREQVRLAQVQYRAGTQPYADVLSLRSQLATYEGTIPSLEQKLDQADDLLAALVGHSSADWSPPPIALRDLKLPGNLPVSLPSALVRQRPDILLAEAAAHAASANVGVATAALLPSVTLDGAYSANSLATRQLFAVQGRAWSFGAGVTAPLFEGGTLWYERKAAAASYQQTMALYRQTVLAAFEQVADTLRALDHDAAALRADDEALRTARQALHLEQVNYAAGLVTYLNVLNADVQYHQAAITDLQAVAQRYQDTVALYVALGGGWWNAGQTVAGR
jgi:NodT family efflux transporter outer membrane factor (OMF) lipoprotein